MELSVLLKTFIVISEAGGGSNGPPSGVSGLRDVWIALVLRTTSLPISIIPGRELSIPHN